MDSPPRLSGDVYRALFETSLDGILLTAPDGRTFDANPAACRIIGRSREEIIAGGRAALVDRTDPRFEVFLEERRRTGRYQGELTYIRPDGSRFPVEISSAIYYDEQGEERATVIFRDVTERKRTEEALRKSEELLARIIETNTDGLMIADREGRITFANPAAQAIYGLTQSAMTDRAYDDPAWRITTLDGKPFPPEERAFTRVMRTGEPVYGIEYAVERPDGRRLVVSINAAPLRDADGTITGVLASLRDVTETKRAEAQLRESEVRFRRLAEATFEGIAITEQGRMVEVNQAFADMFGYPPAELIGKSPTDLVAPESRVLVQRNIACGLEQPYEAIGLRRDGTTFPIEVVGQAIRYQGRPGRVAAVRDLTERRRAQEEQLRAIWESAADAITLSDPDGIVLAANPAYYDLSGYTPEEVLGKSFALIFPEEARERAVEQYQRIFATPQDVPMVEATIRRKDGTERFVEARYRFLERDGRRTGMISMIRDVTERRRAEQAEHRQTERLRILAEASRALAEASLDLPAVLETIVRQVADVIGDSCVLRLLSPDGEWLDSVTVYNPDLEARAFTQDLLSSHPQRVGEGLHGRVAQTGRPLLLPAAEADVLRAAVKPEYRAFLERYPIRGVLIVPVRTRGQVIGTLSVSRPRSERPYTEDDQVLLQDLADRAGLAIDNARLYQEAQALARAREEFLSVAAHELKTPVTSVRGYAQLLSRQIRRGTVDPARISRAIETIDRQSEKLARLLAQLLDISRSEAGQPIVERSPTDVTALVQAAAEAAQATTTHHRIAVQAPEPVWAEVDPLRLEQVVTNLLDNAIKYSPAGGTIDVEVARSAPDLVRLSVRDHGIGIPAEHQPHVFDRFYQIGGGPTRHAPGLGLGLYLSKQIVEQHGGRIAIESPPDGGTCLVVSLPTSSAGAVA